MLARPGEGESNTNNEVKEGRDTTRKGDPF
jgi:hypothetical protein